MTAAGSEKSLLVSLFLPVRVFASLLRARAALYGTCLRVYLNRYDLVNRVVGGCWNTVRESSIDARGMFIPAHCRPMF